MLTPQWFTGLDEKDGILRFDFVSSERCIASTPVLSDRRFDALLTGCGVHFSDIPAAKNSSAKGSI